jgi:hypothetical protein
MGYGLVITRSQITGCRKTPWTSSYEAYFGPGSKATESALGEAKKAIQELLEQKEFELPRESIKRILYRKPGGFSRGHLTFQGIFQGSEENIQVMISSTSRNAGVGKTLRNLLPSLIIFAGDRLIDEKTGHLFVNEVNEELDSRTKSQ